MARSKKAKPGSPPRKRIAIAIELDHPYARHHECFQGILQYAEEHGWSCIIDPYLVGMTGQSDITDYDGIIGRIDDWIAKSARQHKIPVVNHWLNTPVHGLPGVNSDFSTSAKLSAEHLVARGFRRLGYLGIGRDKQNEIEFGAITQVAQAHDLPEPRMHHVTRTFESQRKTFARLRHELPIWISEMTPPFGVIVITGVHARYLAQICIEMGLRVPHDVGIVVQSGDNMVCQSVKPSLSCIEHDYLQVGYAGAAMLDRLMSGGRAKSMPEVFIPPKRLLVRESSDAFVSPDPLTAEALRFIADHARQPLKVEDVADAINTSRRTLERRFEQFVGNTVYGEITRLRTETIKRILMDPDMPLGAVSIACGFSTTSHFTEYFRKSAGITPHQYRKQRLGA